MTKSSDTASVSPARQLQTDVLILGGGPAGTWAAIKASESGLRVVLADKGYCGTSGATASVGTGVWYVEPDSEARERAMASREALGGYLADRRWMHRVLDETYERIDELAQVQRYPFPTDHDGNQLRTGVQGPEYMRRQRLRIKRLGVTILDHTPAVELLTDADGIASGATLVERSSGDRVQVAAKSVVLATGGCAFKSKTLGCDVNTGDGALLAVEAGAELSGMEFSNAYAIAPKGTSVTKTAYYSFATFYREDGSVLDGAGSTRGRSVIARTLQSEPVFARIDQATPVQQAAMRRGQPNFFLPFDRQGINPFEDHFEITLLLEGTVRGTGGVNIVSDDCGTNVPGLFVAGDTATRELICGGFTGGGSHNAAWAISSGSWAGRGAARFAAHRTGVVSDLRSTAQVGIRATGGATVDHRDIVRATQDAVVPFENNLFRQATRMTSTLSDLESTWQAARAGLSATGEQLVYAREAAAMVAHGRWMFHAALARTETRGMHKRVDFPDQDPDQHHRIVTTGLDDLTSKPLSPSRERSAA